jgi:hypothetical protein
MATKTLKKNVRQLMLYPYTIWQGNKVRQGNRVRVLYDNTIGRFRMTKERRESFDPLPLVVSV